MCVPHIGEVIDPEDGLVWRWEKRQEAAAEPSAAPDPDRMFVIRDP
jgi:hypothetical protein